MPILFPTKRTLHGLWLLSFYVFSFVSTAVANPFETEPRYINPDHCSDSARAVIEFLQLPTQLIHSCQSNPAAGTLADATLVSLKYGEAQDCPSGCFYEELWAVADSFGQIQVLPKFNKSLAVIWNGQMLLPDFDRMKTDMDCSTDENILEVKLVNTAQTWAWQYDLHDFTCTWRETMFSDVKSDKIVHHGYRITRVWSGSAFLTLLDGQDVWASDQLRSEEIEKTKLVWEEALRRD